MKKLLVICGPTATGKTALALELAGKFSGELVAADSRQVYRGMDIGTGKDLPVKETIDQQRFIVEYRGRVYGLAPYRMAGVPIWLYDVVDPDAGFSVALFRTLAQAVIARTQAAGKLPILVGGTGLYIESLFAERETFTVPPDPELREQLSKLDITHLQKLVKEAVPEVWQSLNASEKANPRRLVRKIEIAGFRKKFPDNRIDYTSRSAKTLLHQVDLLQIGLATAYPELYVRIDARVDKRIGQGVLREIHHLLNSGFSWDQPAFAALGYKQWRGCFVRVKDGWKITDDERQILSAIQRWKFAEHAYARRQLTWFRKNSAIRWFDVSVLGVTGKIVDLVRSWYTES